MKLKKEFKIDAEIYDIQLLNQAIEIFKEYGDISFDGEKVCISGDNEDEIKELFGEYMNYVLAL